MRPLLDGGSDPLAHPQLRKERKVIRCHPGHEIPDRAGIDHLDGLGHEDMVEAQDGRPRVECRLGFPKGIRQLSVLHPVRDEPIGTRVRRRVEIPQQHGRIAAIRVADPIGADERRRLGSPLSGTQGKMGVDHMDRLAVDFDRYPEGAALLEGWPRRLGGKTARPHDLRGMAGQDGNAVLLAQDPDCGLEVQVHAEPGRHGRRLIDLPCTLTPDADLLQGDDVRIAGRNDIRDPVR